MVDDAAHAVDASPAAARTMPRTCAAARGLLLGARMLLAAILLVLIGAVGAFDVFTFHRDACLTSRPDTRDEAWIHVARGFVYPLQFVLVAEVELHGAWYGAFVALLVLDVAIAVADVAIEPVTRRAQGGLPAGEYAAHMLLSVLVGAYLCALVSASIAWATLPTAIVHVPHAPLAVRVALHVLAAGCLAVTVLDVLALVEPRLRRVPPVQVQVDLRASLADVWTLTQDHRLHPSWDHRFSRIDMLDGGAGAGPRTGTTMRYTKRLCPGVTIHGFGRYKLHRPMRQSTFEFWSADVRSLIRRGVGLWLYTPRPDGTIRFSTSYTYEVRWGVLGRYLDRWIFRRLMQAETDRSFRRLAAEHFR